MSLQDLVAYVVLSAAETYVFHMFFKALLRRNERHDAIDLSTNLAKRDCEELFFRT